MSRLRLQRIEEGLCPRCGGTKPDDEYTNCPDCRERMRQTNRVRRDRRIMNGLCIDCGSPVLDGSRYCPECRDKRNEYSRETRRHAVKNGICVYCHKRKAAYGFTRCPECLEAEQNRKYSEEQREAIRKNNTEWARRKRESDKAKGICYTCHKRKATPGSTQCEYCRSTNRRRATRYRREHGIISRQIAVESGLCYRCLKRKATHGKMCSECYQTALTNINIINSKKGAE